MAIVEITTDNFEATVLGNEIVLFGFWAAWCGPCRGFTPVFEKASQDNVDGALNEPHLGQVIEAADELETEVVRAQVAENQKNRD